MKVLRLNIEVDNALLQSVEIRTISSCIQSLLIVIQKVFSVYETSISCFRFFLGISSKHNF